MNISADNAAGGGDAAARRKTAYWPRAACSISSAIVRPASPDPMWNEFWAAGCPTTVDARTLEATLELISAGRAVAISAAGWARFYPRPGIRSLPVAGLARSDVALGWRKGEANPLVRRFVDLALATARAHPSLVRAIEKPG